MKNASRLLAAVCVLVVGAYAYMAESGMLELLSSNPADSYYNLLVDGFRSGHLSLRKEVPPGLTQLANPYDPIANEVYKGRPYRMLDMSYYKGRLYLYFGVTPALILFWPFTVLTGKYLLHRQAVAIFCAIGFLTSVGLLRAIWRRYFAEVSVWVVVACAVALGFATGVPLLLSEADVYEVAISCGYMLTMLALGAVWCALHEPDRRWQWLAAASVAYGLAVGARPSLLFGGIILLAPVIQAWRERRRIWPVLAAATVPMALIGAGLLLYNELRFDSPLDFGWRYQLTWERQMTRRLFSLRFLWFNFLVYFLEPARWSARFPFVHEAAAPPVPASYGQLTDCFGVLTNIPLVWLVLAVPLAWRSRPGQGKSLLRLFVAATALLFGVCALTLGCFCASNPRYEVDFLPTMVLLAVIGILGVERALAPTPTSESGQASESGLVDRPVWRRVARCGWGVLLGFSAALNLLATAEHYAEAHTIRGENLGVAGRQQEAIEQYEQALKIEPDYARAHNSWGYELLQAGKVSEAIGHFEQALRINPNGSEAHNNLGSAFERQGRMTEAMEQYKQAVQVNPNNPLAHNNLANALVQHGDLDDAVRHYEEALRLNPAYAEAHNGLAIALGQAGRIPEAIEHLQQALRIKSDFAEAHYDLGIALGQAGRIPEAIGHLQQALRIKPDFTEAQKAVARLQAGQ